VSLNGLMRTGVSGMTAQSTRLSGIADNIANNDTTGYKRVSVEFSTLLTSNGSCPGLYTSGGVESKTRHHISEQGALEYTTSKTDLAINGDGFFMVEDVTGAASLTRAGAFVQDGNGYLVNAAGQFLLGYVTNNGVVDVVANGTAGLERVQIDQQALQAQPSTAGVLQVNVPANAANIAAADLPSTNTATSQFTEKTSMVAYSNLGDEQLLDVYWAKIADETWEVAVYDRAESTAGGFPYSGGTLTTATVNFDPVDGTIIAPTSLSLTVPDGQPITLDLSGSSQLAADYAVLTAEVDGQAPSGVQSVAVGTAMVRS
jgi:flagellar hook protein FlgE